MVRILENFWKQNTIYFIFSDDDEFFDLPSDLPSDGELTPTNETINNGGSLSSTNNTNSNGNGNLVEKALERLENELVEIQLSRRS